MSEIIKTPFSIVYAIGNKKHRVDGPAVMWHNGTWAWWLNGEWHRYYGPRANYDRLCADSDLWFIHGKQASR